MAKHEFEHFNPFLGLDDRFGPKLRLRSFIESKLSEQFQLYGYEEVSVPILEKGVFYSRKYVGTSPWPEWNERCMFELNISDYDKEYKGIIKSEKGVLIPEGTLSVGRWLSNLIVEQDIRDIDEILPLKLYYSVSCFRNEPVVYLSDKKKREFKQVGLELLGPTTEMADLEIMYLIVRGLNSIGISKRNINIRIGDIRLFAQLCDACNIRGGDRIVLKEKLDKLAELRAIGKKTDIISLQNELKSYLENSGISSNNLKLWEGLCYFESERFEDTLEFVKENLKNEDVANSFQLIAEMLSFLKISFKIDPCVVRSHEYYTDTVFEVDVREGDKVHLEVAGGGRYNRLIANLLEDTTISIPATGFAYGLERIVNIVKNIHYDIIPKVRYWLDERGIDCILFPRNIKEAWKKAETMRKTGKRIDLFLGGDFEKAKQYAKKKGVKLEVI